MTILVTGGAGYIGSHVVDLLQRLGESVIVVDALKTGDARRVATAKLVRLDLARESAARELAEIMRDNDVDGVIHLAAEKQVGESARRPTHYYRENVGGLANVLDAMEASGVRRLVFSSSAAAYGTPQGSPDGVVDEHTVPNPISPYGETKLIGEWMCRNAERAWGLSWTALRYFNVAGAGAPELGDPAALNLIPLVFEKLDAGEQPLLFGDDYPTPDGTCVRDYVHVSDLADAHIEVLRSLNRLRREERIFNVGTGRGSSVREVLQVIAQVTGRDTTPQVLPRRPGDPAVLVADVSLLRSTLGWTARRSLEDMIQSAWEAWRIRTSA